MLQHSQTDPSSHLLQGSHTLCGFFTSPLTMPIVLSPSPIVLANSTSSTLISPFFSASLARSFLFDRLRHKQTVRKSEKTKTTKMTTIAAPAAVLSFLSVVGLCVEIVGLRESGASSGVVRDLPSGWTRAIRREEKSRSCEGGIVICVCIIELD
jgi:hypothetical protein